VREALDLCLACKGCKGECPVNVDMATYKAEFLAHYYEGRLRPRHAYSMGWIYWWSRLASLAPGLTNFFSQTPGLRDVVKWLGGIAPQRRMPPFARQTFRDWYARRPVRSEGRPPVILWADTFNNHFHPHVAKAAVEVLEAAGFQVWVPRASLCCGRPLFDFGKIDDTKALLRQAVDTLRPQIEAGVPVVGLEPSCLAVFRDELVVLFTDDIVARKLHDQSLPLAEFLRRYAKDFRPPRLPGKALLHVHCHQKALAGTEDETHVLGEMGLDCEQPDEERLLRDGRLFRLRAAALRRLREDRRAGAAAGGAASRSGHAHRGRRLQLQGADRPVGRPARRAPGRGPADGAARQPGAVR
jgi:Fe-S oxidoreductase